MNTLVNRSERIFVREVDDNHLVNCSTNGTFEIPDQWKVSDEAKPFLYILYSLIFVFGVPGNFMVCYVIGLKTKRRYRGEFFILSLAIADLLASAFVPPMMISDLANADHVKTWHIGRIGCYIFVSISPITVMASSWSLLMISLDRCRLV